MSDDAAGTAKHKNDEVIEDAVVVDETTPVDETVPVTETPVVVEEAVVSETEPVIATADPAAVTTESGPRVVYVQVPAAPKTLGNRGVGSLIAVVSAVVFTAILALVTAVIGLANGRPLSFSFLARGEFYIPTLFFVIAFVIVVIIVNRAKWWAFIIGSLVVGVVVYFGSIGLGLLTQQIVLATPEEAAVLFRAALGNPFVIAAALVAREVALWTGGIISRRGTRLRARNLESRAAYERELATTRAEHERAAASAATAV